MLRQTYIQKLSVDRPFGTLGFQEYFNHKGSFIYGATKRSGGFII
jgi:hypothetical protein